MSGRSTRATPTAALLALLFGCVVATPRTAQADGCDARHYLIDPSSVRGLSHLDGLAAAGALIAPESSGNHPEPTVPPPPCSSWRCQNAPNAPAPVIPIPSQRAEPCVPDGHEATAAALASEFLALDATVSLHPIHHPTSIFHPPR